MNLANDSDLIIPGTTGLVTAASTQANLYVTRTSASASQEDRNNMLVGYLGELRKVHDILQGRAKGRPIENLVPTSRLSNGGDRKQLEENLYTKTQQRRPYEDWFSNQ